MELSVANHDRDAAGLLYVYPVVSRRARGVSVGINLNPNRACNFRCIYCQVPGLVHGTGPRIDGERLESELYGMLEQIVHGDFLRTSAPGGAQRLNDVAFSGDGEPSSTPDFPLVVERVRLVLEDLRILGRIKVVLITNGAFLHRPAVQEGLEMMAGMNGEVWFKLDRGSEEGRRLVNDSTLPVARMLGNLRIAAQACRTRIQTCWFAIDGKAPHRSEEDAYIDFLRLARGEGIPFDDVLLYGLARPSRQPEAPRLSPSSLEEMEAFASRIRAAGIPVEVSP